MKIPGCIFLYIILASCSAKKVPDNVLPPDKMGPVIWDAMQADAFTREFIAKDSAKNLQQEGAALQEKIFQKYHTDRETYLRSYRWYSDHGDMMRDMLDSVTARESRKRQKERIDEQLKLKKKNEQNM